MNYFSICLSVAMETQSKLLQENQQKINESWCFLCFLIKCILDKITCSPKAFTNGQKQPHMPMW